MLVTVITLITIFLLLALILVILFQPDPSPTDIAARRIVRSQRKEVFTVVSQDPTLLEDGGLSRDMSRNVETLRVSTGGSPSLTEALQRDLTLAGWNISEGKFLSLQFALALVGVVPLVAGLSLLTVIAATVLPPLLLSTALGWRVDARTRAFDRDFYAFLLSFYSLVRSGLDIGTALTVTVRDLPFESLVRQELERVLVALDKGVPEVDAYSLLGQDFYHAHLVSFRNVLITNRRYGGSVSEAISRLATQSRKQHHLHDRVNSAVRMERTSMWLVTLIMIFLCSFLGYQNPEMVSTVFSDDGIGRRALEVGGFMVFLGFIVNRRLSQFKF